MCSISDSISVFLVKIRYKAGRNGQIGAIATSIVKNIVNVSVREVVALKKNKLKQQTVMLHVLVSCCCCYLLIFCSCLLLLLVLLLFFFLLLMSLFFTDVLSIGY